MNHATIKEGLEFLLILWDLILRCPTDGGGWSWRFSRLTDHLLGATNHPGVDIPTQDAGVEVPVHPEWEFKVS